MVQKVFTVPFAQNGSRTAIPDASQPGGEVSYAAGFGPDYERQLGVDPLAKNIERENFNQTLFDATTSLQEFQAGLGTVPFNAALAAALTPAGYPKGAVIPRTDFNGSWVCTAAANIDDPEITFGKWAPVDVQGVFTQALSNTNITLSLLNAGFPQLLLTGALTANVQVIVPAWNYEYRVVNNCTGAFSVTVKTAAGTGVVVAAGQAVCLTAAPAGVSLSITPFSSASETVVGVLKLATLAQAVAGSEDLSAMTPLKTASLFPFRNVEILWGAPATGTWNRPAGVTKVFVKVVGAGGGGCKRTVSPGPAGGGGGGISEGLIDVSSTPTVAYTVGGGGAGATVDGNNGTAGSTSIFGPVSATGGGGGTFTGGVASGGVGIGGTVNYSLGPSAVAFLGVGSVILGGAGGGGASPGASIDASRPSSPGNGGGGRVTGDGAPGAHGAIYIYY